MAKALRLTSTLAEAELLSVAAEALTVRLEEQLPAQHDSKLPPALQIPARIYVKPKKKKH